MHLYYICFVCQCGLTLELKHEFEKSRLHSFSRQFYVIDLTNYTTGIYVGGNKVVHFTQDKSLSSFGNSISSSIPNVSAACLDIPDCGFRKERSGVMMSCINCFVGNGSLYRFEYGVSRLAFVAKLRGGTCTTADSDPPESVIHKAMYLLQNGFGNYDLFANNCEDFALYCKTGCLVRGQEAMGGSGQASSMIGAPLAAILALPLRLLVSSPVVMVTATAATYTVNRYASDMGVRDDVIKVKVEDIALFHGNRTGGVEDASSDVDDAQPPQKKQKKRC